MNIATCHIAFVANFILKDLFKQHISFYDVLYFMCCVNQMSLFYIGNIN